MLAWTFFALVLLGLVLRGVMLLATARQLRQRRPEAPASWPGVSILKPVKGVDAELEANLHSIFQQRYPVFEVLVAAAHPEDPALAVAREVAAAYPQVPCQVLAGEPPVGPNPKVGNLATMAAHARHELLLISDANVRMAPEALAHLVALVQQPGVGLVSAPIRGTGWGSWGGALDAALLNTFVIGGVAALEQLFAQPCVVGKTMLLRRSALEAMGGFAFLARFLAEDQVCGEEVAHRGQRVVLASCPVDNVTGCPSARATFARYLRWATIRRRMAPAGFAGEILLFPLPLALVGLLLAPGWVTACAGLAALGGMLALGAGAQKLLSPQGRGGWWWAAVLAGDFLASWAWVRAWFEGSVSWRGARYRVGPRTLLAPVETPPSPLFQPQLAGGEALVQEAAPTAL